jgi:hypothetical protein
MMSLLRHTMVSKTGGYLTPRLHVRVSKEVWLQGGARLLHLPEKVRVKSIGLAHCISSAFFSLRFPLHRNASRRVAPVAM